MRGLLPGARNLVRISEVRFLGRRGCWLAISQVACCLGSKFYIIIMSRKGLATNLILDVSCLQRGRKTELRLPLLIMFVKRDITSMEVGELNLCLRQN